jgi:DNA-binding CsgD family transcriptional regulator
METKSLLDEADVRSMVRLLGETCTLKGTINQKKHFLMEGLCRLIDIQAWAWVHAVEMVPGKLPVYVAYIHGGFSEEKLGAFIKIQSHPDMAHMSTPICRELIGRAAPLSRTLQQIVPVDEFNQASVATEWRVCGISPRLLSFHPLADGSFSGLGVYRSSEKPLFTEREARIAHIILCEVPWLHERQGPTAEVALEVPQMPRRQRLALELLLQGLSRKAIADTMDISVNTVAGYVKAIYAFFGVSSQAGLINRFFLGNGGETK